MSQPENQQTPRDTHLARGRNPLRAVGDYIERMDQVEQIDSQKGQPYIDQNATPTSAHLASEAGFIALWAATPFVPALLPVNIALSPFSIPNTYILVKRFFGARRITA